MTLIQGVRVPLAAAPTPEPTADVPHAPHQTGAAPSHTSRNVALSGLAVASIAGGTLIGALRGSPLAGLGIGAAVAAIGVGAALLGSASSSQRDGWCDSYGDPDCDYPGTTPSWRYDPPRYDPPYYEPPYYEPPYNDYPDTGGYPQGPTSYGDD